jgi:lipid II:glycine glycyltransferase (peptidoglycan interpeptide bridge formation enzyme)
MLDIKTKNVNYHRSILNNVNKIDTEVFKGKFDYSFVISYSNFNDEDYEIQDKNAMLVDLSKDLDYILSNFTSTNRKQVRRSEKLDGLKFHYDIIDFDNFYEFYSNCEQDRNWLPVPKEELIASKIIYASYNDIPISGMTSYIDGNYMRLGRIFSLKRSIAMEQPNLIYGAASKRIVFDFCKMAKELGLVSLDLGGVDLNTTEKSGITEFKMSFGGNLIPVKIGRYTKPGLTYKKLVDDFKKEGLDLT